MTMIALIAGALVTGVASCLLAKPRNSDGETFAYSWLVIAGLVCVFAAERLH